MRQLIFLSNTGTQALSNFSRAITIKNRTQLSCKLCPEVTLSRKSFALRHIRDTHKIKENETHYLLVNEENLAKMRELRIKIQMKRYEEKKSRKRANTEKPKGENMLLPNESILTHCKKSRRRKSAILRRQQKDPEAFSCPSCTYKSGKSGRVAQHFMKIHEEKFPYSQGSI